MKAYELLKDLYFFEIERRNAFEETATLRIAIFAGIFGVLSFLAEKTVFSWSLACAWFFCFAAVAAGSGLFSVATLIRCFIGYKWQYLPPPDAILKTSRLMEEYHQAPGYEVGNAEDALEREVVSSLAEAATANFHSNNSRSELMHKCTVSLAIALIATVLAGIPLTATSINTILNRKERTVAEKNKSTPPAPKPDPPKLPPNTVVKGGRDYPRPTTTAIPTKKK